MDSALRLLRDILPFGTSNAEGKNAVAIRNLLETITGLSPQEAVAKMASSVLVTVNQQRNLHMRFKLLEEILREAKQALPALESSIAEAVLPLPLDASTSALHADNLLKGLAVAYTSIAQSIQKSHLEPTLYHLFHRSVQRALAMIARRQLLAYRAYAIPSAGSWQTLHDLYKMVRGDQTKPLDGETASVEHEYLSALLFAYLEPSKFPRAELQTINQCTHRLAAYATIRNFSDDAVGSENAAEACFLVHPDEGTPGYPLPRLPTSTSLFGTLLVDCSQVLAAIDRNLSRRPGKTVDPDLDLSPATLQIVRVSIGGKSARRFSRTHFRPRADVVSGLSQVINFLDGNTLSRRAVDAASRYEGQTFSSSEWALVDESPDGFRLRYVKGEKRQLSAGDLTALQPRESSKTHVCLVRRIISAKGRLELGLQLLTPQYSVVDIMFENAAEQSAIFLHTLPAYGKFPGLIVLPGTCRSGQKVMVKLPGRSLHWLIGACLEANEGLEFFALDPTHE